MRVVLFTAALPSSLVPLKTRRVSPVSNAAERLPARLGVVSSVLAPGDRGPVWKPALSEMALIAAVVVGAAVSRMKERLVERGPSSPRSEITRAVNRYVVPALAGREGMKDQLWPLTVAVPRRTPLP